MPDLPLHVVEDLTVKLKLNLSKKPGYGTPEYLASGGSAAVFKVATPNGLRAIKVFDPQFISDEEGSKERYRLSLQERLIGHTCKSLVNTYAVELAEDTAFVEMEFIAWPQLKNVLNRVPDEAVGSLISQLVEAVTFLESTNIVHRDIKPENIHVSEDWSQLKLLDLGVVREIQTLVNVAETDTGKLRIFLATAQYSSPEYLFRLDEPSDALWRALNIYQVGAVLHDLIMKVPIFNTEMEVGNRWVLAKAVLLKLPSFADPSPDRLSPYKSLASRCLAKDMNLRMSLVKWSDFNISNNNNSFNELRNRLSVRRSTTNNTIQQLEFDREQYKETIVSCVRDKLISICKTDLPLKVQFGLVEKIPTCTFIFNANNKINIEARLYFEWQAGIYLRNVNLFVSACLHYKDAEINLNEKNRIFIGTGFIQEADDSLVSIASTSLADIINKALNAIETEETVSDQSIDGLDLHD